MQVRGLPIAASAANVASSVVSSLALSVLAAAILHVTISPLTAAVFAASCAALTTFGAYQRVLKTDAALELGGRTPAMILAAAIAGSLAAAIFQPGVWDPRLSEMALLASGATLGGLAALESHRTLPAGPKMKAALIVIMLASPLLLMFSVARIVL
jgi:hypothetical protein